MMGWDSRPWKETPFFWSDNTPEKFRELCRRAKAVMDSSPGSGPEKNTAIFCCWNEFGEGHYIEPTRGYGFSYLDVIRDVFCEGPQEHVDIAPEDVGLRGRRFVVSRGPGIGPRPRVKRPCSRRPGRARNWPRGPARWDWSRSKFATAFCGPRPTNGDPAFFSPPLEASRQPRCESGRRDASEPAGRRRPALLVDA